MLSKLTSIASTGASPVAAKVMLGVIAACAILCGIMAWTLYTTQSEITVLTEANTQLKANVQTLKANEQVLTEKVTEQEAEIVDQRNRYDLLLDSYENLALKERAESRKAEKQARELSELKRDLESEEGKFLNLIVPDAVVDAYNLRMRPKAVPNETD